MDARERQTDARERQTDARERQTDARQRQTDVREGRMTPGNGGWTSGNGRRTSGNDRRETVKTQGLTDSSSATGSGEVKAGIQREGAADARSLERVVRRRVYARCGMMKIIAAHPSTLPVHQMAKR